MRERTFAFGKNWQAYVQHALTPQKVAQAKTAFLKLFEGIEFRGKSFLDIGFGQGIALFAAQERGAHVMGIDVDEENLRSLTKTAQMFHSQQMPVVRIASILDDAFVETQLQQGQFDIVHSWGALHHTGNMLQAIHHAASLVKCGGYLVLAIYNKHWSSPIWGRIKWLYNHSPEFVQQLLVMLFYPIIYLAKFVVTGKNPKAKERGMDFFYDVVDWIGGYPYEYASIAAIQEIMERKGFVCVRIIPALVPTGCNQFVFQKRESGRA